MPIPSRSANDGPGGRSRPPGRDAAPWTEHRARVERAVAELMGGAPVEIRETHASLVFLGRESVYKLKKPVDLGFLDYSTLGRRRRMSAAEVDLNRRLAPDVYLGVVTLRDPAEGATGLVRGDRVLDYLVHMRRLPDDRTLSARVAAGVATAADVRAIARTIAAFHRNAGRGPAIDAFGRAAAVRHNVEENFRQIEEIATDGFPVATFGGVREHARALLRSGVHRFEARLAGGWIRDGHGDLRGEHVYLLDEGVRIIDCIEFNRRYRYADVAADVAFLAMDLDGSGAPDLSSVLLAEYEAALPGGLDGLIDFYRSYRAVTRAKVAWMRGAQLRAAGLAADSQLAEARRWLHLAAQYASGGVRPRLVMMAGVTGSGKSTLARALGAILPGRVIVADEVRKRLAGIAPGTPRQDSLDSGLYAPAVNRTVYARLLAEAEGQLALGRTVILDATYRRAADRAAARALAAARGARFIAVECGVEAGEARRRIDARSQTATDWSDGRWEVYLQQVRDWEPLDELPGAQRVAIDAGWPLDQQVEAVLAVLEQGA